MAIVVSLGAAMGIGTSLFSIVNAAWFTPWRVPDADHVRTTVQGMPVARWRSAAEHPHAFTGIGAQIGIVATKTDGELSYAADVSPNFFSVL